MTAPDDEVENKLPSRRGAAAQWLIASAGRRSQDARRYRESVADLEGRVKCGYCGGRHDSAADVRACWERSFDRPPAAGVTPAPEDSLDRSSSPSTPPPNAPDHPPATPAGSLRVTVDPIAVRTFGRSVVVAPGCEAPAAWADSERVPADAGTDDLERAWRERTSLVIECAAEPASDEVERAPAWSLSPDFSFEGERRAHAIFSNALDARTPELRWRWSEEALALGASPGGSADVVLPDGRPAWCDGGPLEWRTPLQGACVLPRLSLLAGSLAPFGDNDTTADLAPDQRAAVCHAGGAARIIAPAGSGKTRVLTERARHLLGHWNLPARALTLVAFNKRAAEEMRERTPDLGELQVRTLNALGYSLVARSEAGTTIEEREVRSILDGLVDLPRRANTDPAAAWIEALSVVRLGLRSPAEVEAEFGGDVDGLPEVFEQYRRILADRGLLDFDEQIYRAIEILLADPEARRRARASCRVLLVDEFQDLTPAHLLLVRLLAGPDGAVFGVGDDDQTIYGYAGASPEWLIRYSDYFPTAGRHALEVNYRCPPAVVEAARTLLTHNRRRVDKRIVAAGTRPDQGSLVVHRGEDPLGTTVDLVEARLRSGAPPAALAVLTRVNASLAPVQVALVHRGVPVRPAVDASYLTRGGVRAALAWLRLASAPEERLAGPDIAAAARRPARGLSAKVVEWMSEQRSVRGLERLAGRVSSGRDSDKILGYAADVRRVREAVPGGTPAVLRVVRDTIGLDQAMQLLEGSRRRLERSAQTDDLDALVALAVLNPEVAGFEEWLRTSLSEPGSLEGVTLATVHRVKGREWPHVVLYGADAGLMPHRLAFDVEEERRVFHVGLTRGRETVDVVSGEVPSPFVAELAEAWTPDRRQLRSRPPVTPTARREATRGRADLPESDEAEEVVARAREALRGWRSRRASTEKKPPYVYLHDDTLETLARTLPSTMVALSRVRGIGPAKLDAYGDEWLALLAEARAAASEPAEPTPSG